MALNLLLEQYIPSIRNAGQVITALPVVLSGTAATLTMDSGATATLPASTTIGGSSVSALGAITSTGATAFTVASTATNYGLQVDESTGSAITGLKIKAAASGAGVALSALGGTNELVTIDGKATGTVGINTISTTSGLVTIGNSTSLAGAAVNGAVVATKQLRSSTATALAASGNAALDPTLGQVFTLTPTGTQNITAGSAPVGATIYLVVTTSGTNSYTQTFTTNFKTTTTLATGASSGKVFVITFVGDGTNLNEIARTTAM